MKKSQLINYSILVIAFTMFNPIVNAQSPKMEYSTLLGGSGWDYGHAITIDDKGSAYIAGQVNSTNFPTTSGAYDKTANGNADVYVTKLNKDGNALVYSTYIGGSGFDDTRKVFVDKAGLVYLTGSTQSTNFPTTSGSLQGNSQGYFLKLDSLGSKIAYSSKWNGGEKILVDSKGYLIIMGSTDSTKFPTTSTAYCRTFSGGSDLFVAKIDINTNQVIFSTLIGGSGNEWAPSMILDSQDNIIIVGQTTSQNFPIKGNTFANYTDGKSNVFVTKLASDGTQLNFSTLVGGTDSDWPWDVTVDLGDNVYVTGVTLSSDFPVSASAYVKTYKGLQDAFLFKLKSDGSQLLYSSYIGGTDQDGGRGVVVDKYGKAYITGCTRSTNFPVSTNAFDKTYNGGGSDQWAWGDPFLFVMNTDGTQVEYSTYLGGSNDEEAYGIAIDKFGDIYLCGVTSSSNFPTTAGAYSRTLRGGCNIYVTKFSFNTDYFGQTPPGDMAVKFAPGIISIPNRLEKKIAFSPDGNECYFEVVISGDSSKIYYKKRVNNTWSEQVELPFSVNHNASDPFFSNDGKRLYFTNNYRIYFVERTTGEWGEPQLLPSPINSTSFDWGYTETTDGTAYVTSARTGGMGDPMHGDIWCIPYGSSQAKNLGPVVNSIMQDANPCIAPDGSFLIFNTNGHSNCWNDLFITFNKGNKGWTAPLEMNSCGAQINIHTQVQFSPSLSPDGKFLFFSRVPANPISTDPMDIYWVSTHVIVGLKKAAFAPKLSNQISNASIKADTVFNYVIPSNTFTCEYGTETLKYTATLSDGSALPSWLTFNAGTRTLSGTPKQAEVVNIKIIATNTDTVSATCTFKITVMKTTGIEESSNNIPTEFKLCQNYPNPFNPTTVISYHLPVYSNVRLKIYDTLGREVKILVDLFQNAGEHSITWNATDKTNNPVSSGIYFYKMESGGKSFLKKMILIQ